MNEIIVVLNEATGELRFFDCTRIERLLDDRLYEVNTQDALHMASGGFEPKLNRHFKPGADEPDAVFWSAGVWRELVPNERAVVSKRLRAFVQNTETENQP